MADTITNDTGDLVAAVQSDGQLRDYLAGIKNGSVFVQEDDFEDLYRYMQTLYISEATSNISLGYTYFSKMCNPQHQDDKVLDRAVLLTTTAALINPSSINFKYDLTERFSTFCQSVRSQYGLGSCKLLVGALGAVDVLKTPPDLKMTLKHVAVILGDHWIKGLVVNGVKYEGAEFGAMVRFVSNTLEKFSVQNEITKHILDRFKEFLRFGAFIELGKTLIAQKILAHAFYLYIELLNPGESALLPFGWACASSAVSFSSSSSGAGGKGKDGHAMLVEFTKLSDHETDLTIFNSGAGIRNHPSKRDGEIMRYAPDLVYNRIEIEALKMYSFFEGLISLKNPVQVIPLDVVDEDDIYKVLMRPFLGNISETRPSIYIKDQQAGTCSFSVLTAYLITKLEIQLFRAVRRQLDFEGWNAGFAIAPDSGHEEIKQEILQRGIQTVARRLYRHSKRGDSLENHVQLLQSMHEKLKEMKLNVKSEIHLPELNEEELVGMDGVVKRFLHAELSSLPLTSPLQIYQGGFGLPRFENDIVKFIDACTAFAGSKDPLLANDNDFVRSVVIQAIIKEMPDPEDPYWESLNAHTAQIVLMDLNLLLFRVVLLLELGLRVSYSGLVALTKLYLASWVCATRINPEIYEGYRPSLVYITNALNQDSMFTSKPDEKKLMKRLLKWASTTLQGDTIFDYKSWRTNGQYLIFDHQDHTGNNAEIRLVKNMQTIVSKSQNFEQFKEQVTQSFRSIVPNGEPGSIDDGVILGYLWAKGSETTFSFNYMRDTAMLVMTAINKLSSASNIPREGEKIHYAKNEESSYNLWFKLKDCEVTGLNTSISEQEMFFGIKKFRNFRDQNDIIKSIGNGALSIECINDSKTMRIPNIISNYTDEPCVMLSDEGIELLVASIMNPIYNATYLKSPENSQKLLEFLEYLMVFYDGKIKAEGLLNSTTCPTEFTALTGLIWLKSKVLVMMREKGHPVNDIVERKALRQRLVDLLSKSQELSKSFISTATIKNLLHAFTALTYTKEDLVDLKTYGEFLKQVIKVTQATSEIFPIVLEDLWGLLIDLVPLIKNHAASFDMNFIRGIFPEFYCERVSYVFPVLQLQSTKDLSGNHTMIRLNIISGFFTMNDSPSGVRIHRIFRNMNLNPKNLNFESSISGNEIMLTDKRGHKLVVKNGIAFYVVKDGSLCQAVEPKEIRHLNRLRLYAQQHPNRKKYDLWICPATSSVGAIMTDSKLNIVMRISSDGKVRKRKSAVQRATIMGPVKIFDTFEMSSAVTLFFVKKRNRLIFSFTRYETEDGKRLTLIADRHDLKNIKYEQEYIVEKDQTISYGKRFGRYLVVSKIEEKSKANKSTSLKILIPFFNAVQRYQEPELGETTHTCYFMDLNEDRTIRPLSRTHALLLAHQLLWAGSYHETFNLLQTIDQNSNLSDNEAEILASIIMYPNFSFDSRPEASAISVHALSYFYKMTSRLVDGDDEELCESFIKIILSKEIRAYKFISEMAQDKLHKYYRNENNVPLEMRIMNQRQAITSMGWLDLQMMKSHYLKFEKNDKIQLSPRFSLKRLPKSHSQSFSEIHRLALSADLSSSYSLFRPSEGSFCAAGFASIDSSMVSTNDIQGQSTLLRLSHSREEKSVQGMRRIIADVPRQTWENDVTSGKVLPKKKKERPAYKPGYGQRNPFNTDQIVPKLADRPLERLKVKIDEAEELIDLPNVELDNRKEPEKINLEQFCAENGYCKHRYAWFNEEIELGRHAYMEKSKNAEEYIKKLSDILEEKEELHNLIHALNAAIFKETESRDTAWEAVKRLSVTILQSSAGAKAYFMKIGRLSLKPNKRSLTNAFIRESFDNYLEIYPDAALEQIQEIHRRIGVYYSSQTKLQHFQRALNLVEKIDKHSGAEGNSHKHEKRLAFVRALKEELVDKVTRAYRIDKFPVFAVFESFANVRLRQDQVDVLKLLLSKSNGHDYDSRIVQMMMSGGKTFVLGTLLAFCKADGYHLSTIIVPQSLFETNYLDMKDRSWRYFRQPCYPFTFDRTSRSTSENNIKMLLQKLYSVIKHRGYIITTPQSMQNLANTFTEFLTKTAPEFEGPAAKSMGMLKELVHIFLTRGAATFDEIDLNFVPTKELNFPTSAKKGLDEVVLETMKRVFYWIATDKTLNLKLDVLHNRQAFVEQSDHPDILHNLIDLLYQELSRDKTLRMGYHLPEKFDKKEFFAYMMAKNHDAPPALISLAYLESESTQKSVGLQRILELHYILHTDLLQSLTRTVNLHFGPSFKHSEVLIAKPYVAANTPSETSDFAGKWETVCKTFIMYISNSICMDYDEKKMEAFMKFLQIQARKDAREVGEIDLSKTRASAYFSKATGEDLFFTSLSNGVALKRLHKKAIDKSIESIELVVEFAHSEVLLPLKVYLDQIFSFPLNVPSMFRSTQGYSGTIDEIFNFPHEIIFPGKEALESGHFVSDQVKHDAGSSGWIITNLIREDNRIIACEQSDDTIAIPDIMEMAGKISNSHRVLIDLGALFKGHSNLQVAKGLAQYFADQKNNAIGAVLFFDNFTDRLMYIRVGDNEEKEIAGTSSALIKSTTKLPHTKLFTFLDNNHFTGVDILQMFDSRAIMTTNSEFTARDLVQAIMRMRGFLKKQRVDFLITKDLKSYMESKKIDFSLTGLVAMSVRNSIDLEQKYYERVGFQKLTNFYRQFILRQIIMAKSPAIYGELYVKLAELFKRSSEKNYFGLTFGAFKEEKITRIMKDYKKNILALIEPYITAEEHEFLTSTTDQIIAQGQRYITRKLPYKNAASYSFDSEATVEVSSQIETEQQMEQNSSFLDDSNLHLGINWGGILDEKLEPCESLRDDDSVQILSIQEAIKKSEDIKEYNMLFDSRLCASTNYLFFEKKKICLFEINQKQIHTLLAVVAKENPKRVKSLIALANQEADELSGLLRKAELHRHDVYLVDAFGTIIESRSAPSAEVVEDLKNLLLDANLLSGNIINLGQPPLNANLNSWVGQNTGLKVRFINELVRKSMKYSKSNDIVMTTAYRMLKEHCDDDCGIVSGDIFSQKLHPSRINEIYMSILEHVNYFGIQCNRFNDYLEILQNLSEVIDYPQGPTYQKICGLIIPRLVEHCSTDDDKVKSLLTSIKYIDDDGKVIESLKGLANRKQEYRSTFDNTVKEIIHPKTDYRHECHQLRLYFASLIIDDEITCKEFVSQIETMHPYTFSQYFVYIFQHLRSRQKTLPEHFKSTLETLPEVLLKISPIGFFEGLMTEDKSVLTPLLLDKLGTVVEKLKNQEIEISALVQTYMYGNNKQKDILDSKEREEIFEHIYFSGAPISNQNKIGVFSSIRYVYRETDKNILDIVLKFANHDITIFKRILGEVLVNQEYAKGDLRDFFDKLIDLAMEKPDVEDAMASQDTMALQRMTEYLKSEYPMHPRTLVKILSNPRWRSPLPVLTFATDVLEYAAKTFVTDKAFIRFLDDFLRDKPKEMHHYVRNCISVGSMEYLKLKSFMYQHYRGNGFNIDYFLRDYEPVFIQAPPPLIPDLGVRIESASDSD